MLRSLVSVVGILLSAEMLSATDFELEKYQNWHQWRGPDANGFAAKGDPPTKWDANKNILWKAELPGKGSSTPTVWGPRIFVLTAVKSDCEAKPDELPKPDPRFQTKTEPLRHL